MLGISNCQPNDGNQSRKEASFSSVGNADIFHLTSGSGRGSGRGPLRRRAYVDAYSLPYQFNNIARRISTSVSSFSSVSKRNLATEAHVSAFFEPYIMILMIFQEFCNASLLLFSKWLQFQSNFQKKCGNVAK